MTRKVTRLLLWTAGGKRIGLGHVRRCASLAVALRDEGIDCSFLLDDEASARWIDALELPGTPIGKGWNPDQAIRLARQQGAGIFVVDSYEAGDACVENLGAAGFPVVLIDDLGVRDLAVDMVVNGGLGAEEFRYPRARKVLLGARYSLLRREFSEEPSRKAEGGVRRVLITVGGSDPYRLTRRLLQWSRDSLRDASFDVVAGPLFDDENLLEGGGTQGESGIMVHRDPENMRDLMRNADLALCAGGQTLYELAAVATPSIAVQTADNQSGNLKAFSSAGALTWVGAAEDPDLRSKVVRAIHTLVADQKLRRDLGHRGRALVDGQGARRVASAVVELLDGRAPQ